MAKLGDMLLSEGLLTKEQLDEDEVQYGEWEAFQRHESAINGGLSFYMRRRKAQDLAAIKARGTASPIP